MGFRADVENFQPLYVYSNAHQRELAIGATILKEAVDRETDKAQRAAANKAREKEAASSILQKVVPLSWYTWHFRYLNSITNR